jgi:hypothetical protein
MLETATHIMEDTEGDIPYKLPPPTITTTTHQEEVPYHLSFLKGESWVEQIPIEQRYTDYVPETRVEYRPIEKSYTDYIESNLQMILYSTSQTRNRLCPRPSARETS